MFNHFKSNFFVFLHRLRLFSTVNLDDSVLIDVLEYVRRVHEDPNGAGSGDNEEDVELQAINHHRDILPVFAGLKGTNNSVSHEEARVPRHQLT
jgi:hypothetical protein